LDYDDIFFWKQILLRYFSCYLSKAALKHSVLLKALYK